MDGQYLRKKRKSADITQIELADMLGVTQNLVSLWETNRCYPRLDTAIKIADILDCSIEELFTANKSRYSTKKMSLCGIGISMRNARKTARYSARQLSEETGVSKTTIYRAENGEVLPTLFVLFELSGALGITVDEYIGRV